MAGFRPGKTESEQEAYGLAVAKMKRRVPRLNAKIPVNFTYKVGDNKFRGISAVIPERYQVWHYFKRVS